jgi:hypothetical protein
MVQRDYLTLGEAAHHLAVKTSYPVQTWHIRRLYTRKLLPAPQRVGLFRVVSRQELPTIERALRAAGYLPQEVPA